MVVEPLEHGDKGGSSECFIEAWFGEPVCRGDRPAMQVEAGHPVEDFPTGHEDRSVQVPQMLTQATVSFGSDQHASHGMARPEQPGDHRDALGDEEFGGAADFRIGQVPVVDQSRIFRIMDLDHPGHALMIAPLPPGAQVAFLDSTAGS